MNNWLAAALLVLSAVVGTVLGILLFASVVT